MKKTWIALAAAAAVTVASVAVPSDAHAQRGVAAGLFGGLVAGTIIGSAMAPRYYYAPAPVYVAPPPRGCVEQQWVWSPRRGDYVLRNVRVPCY
ncbi:MAG: hypothetical protein IT538_09355 [Variibacter sp.]|nr:hypothetical protein [Variibacter sp.]